MKTLLLILLLVPMISFGQDKETQIKELKEKYEKLKQILYLIQMAKRIRIFRTMPNKDKNKLAKLRRCVSQVHKGVSGKHFKNSKKEGYTISKIQSLKCSKNQKLKD